MEDVADRAGVSRALVSLVMRESPKVSNRSRAAVLTAAGELGYRPNLMARNLASRSTDMVGVMLNDLLNPFFAEIAEGILDAAAERDVRVLFNTGSRSTLSEQRAVENLLELRTEGIILVGTQLSAGYVEQVAGEVPVLVVGRTVPTAECDTVNNDECIGSRLAVKHLIGLGHTDIAHIDGGHGAGAPARRATYIETMATHDLAAVGRVFPGGFTERSGHDAASAMLDDGPLPTALFAANDLCAVGALSRFGDTGVDVPGRISIVGYDNIALAAMHHIGLTTIHQPRFEMGRLALETLLQRVDNPSASAVHHVVAPSIVVRTTTAPPP
jgi:DNA-binding LacI/PurR family transcriptional regulator